MAVSIITRDTPVPQWLTSLSSTEAEKLESWPPARHSKEFDWTVPTNEQYHDPTLKTFASRFAEARKRLDYDYHRNPVCPRQELQDAILTRVLAASKPLESTSNTKHTRRPWLVFTAGAMGAGKGYVLSTLHNSEAFPMSQFVMIDPDKLKNELPEMAGYLQEEAESAATKVHRESTFMSDVLFEYTLLQQRSLVVDGSLRDVDWYTDLFAKIRREHPQYQIGILHVSAERSVIHERARKRAELSGRVVPPETIDQSIAQVPKSVNALAPLADVVYEIDNGAHSDLTIRRKLVFGEQVEVDPEDWDEFATVWVSDIDSDTDTEMETDSDTEMESDGTVYVADLQSKDSGYTQDEVDRVGEGSGVVSERQHDKAGGESTHEEVLDVDMYERSAVRGFSGPSWISTDQLLAPNRVTKVSTEGSNDITTTKRPQKSSCRNRSGTDGGKKEKIKGEKDNWLKSSLTMLSPLPKKKSSVSINSPVPKKKASKTIMKPEQKKKAKKKCKMTKHVKRTLGRMRLSSKCCMNTCWDNAEVQRKANDVWKQAYPSFCPRCTLTGDSQCGVCIHGDYSCACQICNAKALKGKKSKDNDRNKAREDSDKYKSKEASEKDKYHLSCPIRAKFFESMRFFDPVGMTSMVTKKIKD